MVGRDAEFFDRAVRRLHGVDGNDPARAAAGDRGVQGIATAAGCQLVAACDLAVAAERARFAATGVRSASSARRRGWRFAKVGRKRALEMLVTGDPIAAATARDRGSSTGSSPADQLEDAVSTLVAADRCVEPTHGGGSAKRRSTQQVELDEHGAYELTRRVMAGERASRRRTGRDKRLPKRKRPPTWSGS